MKSAKNKFKITFQFAQSTQKESRENQNNLFAIFKCISLAY